MHQQIDQLMRDVVEWKEKEDKSVMILVIVECLDKNINKKINYQVQKLDKVEKKWHMEKKQFVVLKEVIKTWKTKHEESLNKPTMI